MRFAAGADAVAAFERRANNLLAQANAYRDLSRSLALDSDFSGRGDVQPLRDPV